MTANFDGDGDGDGFAYNDFRIACEGHEPVSIASYVYSIVYI